MLIHPELNYMVDYILGYKIRVVGLNWFKMDYMGPRVVQYNSRHRFHPPLLLVQVAHA